MIFERKARVSVRCSSFIWKSWSWDWSWDWDDGGVVWFWFWFGGEVGSEGTSSSTRCLFANGDMTLLLLVCLESSNTVMRE